MSKNEEKTQGNLEDQALDKIALALILVAKRLLAESDKNSEPDNN